MRAKDKQRDKPATIKDVAARAGVSFQTVSRVINNRGEISPETRARVLAVIEELGYRPNAVARSLRQSRTKNIGLILPTISNTVFAELAQGVQDTAQQAGYSVILCTTNESSREEAACISMLQRGWIAGLVLTSAHKHGEDGDHLRRLASSGTPAVLALRKVPDVGLGCVRADDRGGACAAVSHLIELGHRRIAIITGPLGLVPAADRLDGYRQALDGGELPFDPSLILEGDFFFESGRDLARSLLNRSDRPTAVFVSNDMMALGVLQQARRCNLRVPEDLAIVGFDDILSARISGPPLTTVAWSTYQSGVQATSRLLKLAAGEPEKGAEAVLPCRLIVRGSTAGGSWDAGDAGEERSFEGARISR